MSPRPAGLLSRDFFSGPSPLAAWSLGPFHSWGSGWGRGKRDGGGFSRLPIPSLGPSFSATHPGLACVSPTPRAIRPLSSRRAWKDEYPPPAGVEEGGHVRPSPFPRDPRLWRRKSKPAAGSWALGGGAWGWRAVHARRSRWPGESAQAKSAARRRCPALLAGWRRALPSGSRSRQRVQKEVLPSDCGRPSSPWSLFSLLSVVVVGT